MYHQLAQNTILPPQGYIRGAVSGTKEDKLDTHSKDMEWVGSFVIQSLSHVQLFVTP